MLVLRNRQALFLAHLPTLPEDLRHHQEREAREERTELEIRDRTEGHAIRDQGGAQAHYRSDRRQAPEQLPPDGGARHVVDSGLAPKGTGETSVPPIAPAVATAVFAATGARLRNSPFTPEKVRAALG